MKSVLGRLDEELIAKIRLIQMRAKFLVNDVFAGMYESAFKGRGMEFEEVREYFPGDDVRHIDWNVTARMNRPFIKLHRDERELTVMFLVDVSASAQFGTLHKFKNEVAAEITALLAYSALRSNDKVGLIVFSDHVEHFLPPKKGRGHIWQVIRDVLSYQSKAIKTDFAAPLDFLNRVVTKRAVVFLISDFQGKVSLTQMRVAAKRHDLIAVSVTDPKELELPRVGFLELEDAETGEIVVLNTNQKAFLADYRARVAGVLQKQQEFFFAAGIDHVPVSTAQPYMDAILKFFRKRES